MDTATPLEIAWTIGASLAVVLHLWTALDAREDLYGLGGEDRGVRLIAHANMWVASGLALVQLVFVLVGVRAMAYPAPTPTGDPDAGALLAGLSFIGAEVVLVLISALGVYVRRQVRTWAKTDPRWREES